MRTRVLVYVIVIPLFIAAIWGLLILGMSANKPVEIAKPINPIVVGVGVSTETLWRPQIKATGTLQAEESAMLKSAVNQGGIITKILFESGERVKKGQALFHINPHAGSIVRAPFDGRLGLKLVSEGDYVAPGTDLVPIAATDAMRVEFTVPQSTVADLQGGEAVTVSVNAYPEKTFQGTVYAINTSLDLTTRNLNVWAHLPNPGEALIPGMFVDVIVYTQAEESAITVPETAIVYNQAGNYVYRVIDGKAVMTPVELGAYFQDHVRVLDGLKAGEPIIVSGTQKVFAGWAVKAIDTNLGTSGEANHELN